MRKAGHLLRVRFQAPNDLALTARARKGDGLVGLPARGVRFCPGERGGEGRK